MAIYITCLLGVIREIDNYNDGVIYIQNRNNILPSNMAAILVFLDSDDSPILLHGLM
jgi:hypothetical protein